MAPKIPPNADLQFEIEVRSLPLSPTFTLLSFHRSNHDLQFLYHTFALAGYLLAQTFQCGGSASGESAMACFVKDSDIMPKPAQ